MVQDSVGVPSGGRSGDPPSGSRFDPPPHGFQRRPSAYSSGQPANLRPKGAWATLSSPRPSLRAPVERGRIRRPVPLSEGARSGPGPTGDTSQIHVARTSLIQAPLLRVWGQSESLDEILATSLPRSGCETAADRRSATIAVPVTLGPMRWVLEGRAHLDAYPHERIVMAAEVPRLALRYEGRLWIRPLGAAITRLAYEGHLDCHHRIVCHLPRLLTDLVEDHVRRFVAQVKTRAERHHLAQQRLG
jgi:hypothetical protein